MDDAPDWVASLKKTGNAATKPRSPPPKPPKKTSAPTKFSAALARRLLREICLGATLTEVCLRQGMPDLLVVYGWLRSTTHTVDDKLFAKAYQQACEDRALTWADQASTAYKDLVLDGSKADFSTIKIAGDEARLRLGLIKEQRLQMATLVKQGGHDTPTVVIQTFAPEAAALFGATADAVEVAKAKDHRNPK